MKARGLLKALRTIVLVAVAGFLAPSMDADANTLSAAEAKNVRAVIQAMDKGNWRSAKSRLKKVKNPLALKIVTWFNLTQPDTPASYEDIIAFIRENPDWPNQSHLLRRAEENMPAEAKPADILAWFDKYPPVSIDGLTRQGAALVAVGRKEEGREILRKAWIGGNFGKRQQKDFYRLYRKYLTREDHIKRLDGLIWDGRYWQARRMLWKVDPKYRALAEARLMLMRMEGNVDAAIRRVPAALKNDPGLVYERLRWRRRKGRDLDARELLVPPPADLVRPEKWWKERANLARRALDRGHISEAYRLVKDHRLSQGIGFAESEWLAGWIALRFLGDNQIALDHFAAMFKVVKYPVSRARAAYWAARAAEALGETKTASRWYESAARYVTAYYGQLAAARIAPGHPLEVPPSPAPSPAEVKDFASRELTRVVRLLSELKLDDLMRPFILALAEQRESLTWKILTAELAEDHGRSDLAVAMAKEVNSDGVEMTRAGYPILKPPPHKGKNVAPPVELPLILAMIRQESAFRAHARSRAGARGLMQIMPATGKKVARQLGIPYSRRRLTTDADYNMRLGQAYLTGMVEKFGGSYVLALAAYNAGPARARKWIRDNGNPQDGSIDTVDWIEMIPFDETRDYVQRVLENLQIYRARLAKTKVAFNLEKDLQR